MNCSAAMIPNNARFMDDMHKNEEYSIAISRHVLFFWVPQKRWCTPILKTKQPCDFAMRKWYGWSISEGYTLDRNFMFPLIAQRQAIRDQVPYMVHGCSCPIPKADLHVAGFPCISWSIQGKGSVTHAIRQLLALCTLTLQKPNFWISNLTEIWQQQWLRPRLRINSRLTTWRYWRKKTCRPFLRMKKHRKA